MGVKPRFKRGHRIHGPSHPSDKGIHQNFEKLSAINNK